MTCPRCTETMVEDERGGVVINRCAGCRGIWLDRGELEALMAERGHPTRGRDELAELDEDDGDARHPPQRRRGWLASLGELFD